jgi:hypothetical protein
MPPAPLTKPLDVTYIHKGLVKLFEDKVDFKVCHDVVPGTLTALA